MKVSAVHINFNRRNQFQNNTFKNNSNSNIALKSSLNKNDVFVRLAAASTKDARIEKELSEMGLI